MPELPEMETYKNLLNQKISGKVINDIQINREKSINMPSQLFISRVKGQKILDIQRRAKHLLFRLESGDFLLLHLMLGGWMFYGSENEKPKRTIQIRLSFGEEHLYFIGFRLGYLDLYSEKEVYEKLSDLGPEPLGHEFSMSDFLKLIKPRHGHLKTKLIDQSFLSGIGNCYSDEICYKGEILPTKNIDEMEERELNRLYDSIQYVLRDAIKHGGYMANPLFNGDKLTGGYDQLCMVTIGKERNAGDAAEPLKKRCFHRGKPFFAPTVNTSGGPVYLTGSFFWGKRRIF